MKGTFYFLVKPKKERYNNVKKIGDKFPFSLSTDQWWPMLKGERQRIRKP